MTDLEERATTLGCIWVAGVVAVSVGLWIVGVYAVGYGLRLIEKLG